jgi:hypothetical protein
MNNDDRIERIFVFGLLFLLAFLLFLFMVFGIVERMQKDRELDIREREIELKAEQYPYLSETKIEVKHE